MSDRTQLGKALAAIDAKIASLQASRTLVIELFQKKAAKPARKAKPEPGKDFTV